MASDLQQTLDRISRKALHLTERYRVVDEQRRAAQARIQELEELVADLRKQVEDLRMKNEYLMIASTVNPTRQDVERSRAVISGLVREIDKCITELNE